MLFSLLNVDAVGISFHVFKHFHIFGQIQVLCIPEIFDCPNFEFCVVF
jgi:hypothetical protein